MLGIRDRALLALGFAGAFRRSELVALRLEDPTEVPDGYRGLNRARRRRNVEAWRGLGGMADLHTRKLIEQARRNRELARATRRASNACVKDSKRLIRESRELLANTARYKRA